MKTPRTSTKSDETPTKAHLMQVVVNSTRTQLAGFDQVHHVSIGLGFGKGLLRLEGLI